MDDLELTRLCAEAMGIHFKVSNDKFTGDDFIEILVAGNPGNAGEFNPLHDDAQAMVLVKRFSVKLTKRPRYETWRAVCYSPDNEVLATGTHNDLNRAICLCVAKRGEG